MMGQALGIENAAHHSSTSTHVPEKCSRQRNSIDCGYFVMRFMKEVVMEYPNKIPDNYFDGHKCPSYSMEKHDEHDGVVGLPQTVLESSDSLNRFVVGPV
ncbi:hypothetical protein P8452_18431 [Trifolium repens]|nr:hypothetical protein P8452_18431 [Trifolium repens]